MLLWHIRLPIAAIMIFVITEANNTVQIKKCCSTRQVLDTISGRCQNSSREPKQLYFNDNVNEPILNYVEGFLEKGEIFKDVVVDEKGYVFVETGENSKLCNDFCVEFDMKGILIALVNMSQCPITYEDPVKTVAEIVEENIQLSLKIISILCLIVTAVLYLIVPLLNDLTGKALAIHCIFLATGSLLKILNDYWLATLMQLCQISAYIWLTIMWINIYLVVHRTIKKEKCIRENPKSIYIYCIVVCAICVPVLLVSINNYWPSLNIRLNHGYRNYVNLCVMISILLNLLISLSLYIPTKMLLRSIEERIRNSTLENCRNRVFCRFFRKYQRLNRATIFFTIVTYIVWILEIIFTVQFGSDDLSGSIAVIDSSRGILAIIIFTCLPFYRRTIKDWYNSRWGNEKPQNED